MASKLDTAQNGDRWRKWGVRGLIGMAIIPMLPPILVAVAFVVVHQLFQRALGRDRVAVTSTELASRMQKFVDGSFDEDDYGDMTQRLKDRDLDAIRRKFMKLKFPLSAADHEALKELIAKVEAKVG